MVSYAKLCACKSSQRRIEISAIGTIMIDLNSLAIFATVVDANGFSEAARRLNMPVSTVSRRITDLEDQLGVRLIERSTRSFRPH
jgi:hypothetical protein